SVFFHEPRWTSQHADEVYHAFVEHPDVGADDFITKLKGQMRGAGPAAQQLVAELLWALLLFPSNIKPRTKRQQVREYGRSQVATSTKTMPSSKRMSLSAWDRVDPDLTLIARRS